MKRLENIKNKNEKQLKAIEDQGEQQLKNLKILIRIKREMQSVRLKEKMK